VKLTIRKKLVFIATASILLLFLVVATVFITRTKDQLSSDIYVNNLAYTRAASEKIEDLYFLYLKQDAEVIFNREVNKILDAAPDLNRLRVATFAGDLIYDSSLSLQRRFKISSPLILRQVRSRQPSFRLKSLDDAYFVGEGPFNFTDYAGQNLLVEEDDFLIDYFVLPINEEISLIFDLDYSVMNQRVNDLILRIVVLALIGLIIAVYLAALVAKQFVKPINSLVEGAQKVSAGNLDTQVNVKTNDELSFLASSFNKMTQDLKVSLEAKLYQERVEHELGLASEIQKNLLPEKICEVSGLDMAAGLIPAEEIGGDIYDFMKLNDEKVMFYLGDVTGHGVPAGIVSSVANALFYGFQGHDLKEILVAVNNVLKVKTVSTMFMTLCLMSWDAKDHKFSYASAGHEQIVKFSAKDKKATLQPSGGIALGMIDDISKHIEVLDVDLEVGDYLVIYSDGIPEAWRSKEELYGMERFTKSIENCAHLETAEDIKKAILADVEKFAAGYRQMDDITIIVVKRI
jgi:HAMP domain-containing protein